MGINKKYDKPEKYPYGYIESKYGIEPLNQQGYIGNFTDATGYITLFLLIKLVLLGVGAYWLFS